MYLKGLLLKESKPFLFGADKCRGAKAGAGELRVSA
jgi:hypothetical protein